MPEKQRWPRPEAVRVAQEVARALKPHCLRIIVAGSVRRGKPNVGDVEILYISKTQMRLKDGEMFEQHEANLADDAIKELEKTGVLERRKNVNGSTVFGQKNKLMVHVATGMPVDLFSTTEESWFNDLVCRTGPAESNTLIAMAAQRKGFKWNPYGPGFTDRHMSSIRMISEREVFQFVNLPWPNNRVEVPL